MKKLLKLKKWLTLDEAAAYLSNALSEPVSKADVLRLGLDSALTLSVYFVEGVYGKIGRAVPLDQAPKVPGIPVKGVPPYEVTLGFRLNESEVLLFDDPVRHIGGLFDLPMVGGERINCEELYQKLTDGPHVDLSDIDGTFLRVPESSEYVKLYEEYLPDPKPGDQRPRWQRRDELVQYPIGRLPDGAVFVVRVESLTSLIEGLEGEQDKKPPAARERTTYLNIIGALLELVQTPRPGRESEAAVIRELVEGWPDKSGISARTLATKFAEAKRSLRDS